LEDDFAGAERLLLESSVIWEKTLSSRRVDLAENWVDLATILSKTGRRDEARAWLEKAVDLRVERIGPLHRKTAEARDQLLTLLLDTHEWSAAESLGREMVDLYDQKYGAEAPLPLYTRAQVGAAVLGLGRIDEAEPLLLGGWKAIGENPKYWVVNKLFLLDNLVKLYTERGDEASVALYRDKADALRKSGGK